MAEPVREPAEASRCEPYDVPTPFEVGGPGSGGPPTFCVGFCHWSPPAMRRSRHRTIEEGLRRQTQTLFFVRQA